MFNVHGKESRVRMHGEELHQLCCLFPLFASSVRIVRCRLRHSSSLERDSSPQRTFPTEWPGFRTRTHVRVKHSRSITPVRILQVVPSPYVGLLAVHHRQILCEMRQAACHAALMCQSVKPKQGCLRSPPLRWRLDTSPSRSTGRGT